MHKVILSLMIFSLLVPDTLFAAPQTLSRPDGTKIVYEVFGDPAQEDAVLILHCWGCDRSYWDNQVPKLAEDFRVVTLDLPGHGDSATPRKDWTFDAMTDEIAAVARELNLKKFVVVGHSMGGTLALLLAAKMPEQVQGIVCVDTLQNAEFDFKNNGFNLTEETFEQQVGQFLPMLVHPESDPGIPARLLNQALKTDRQVAMSLWQEFSRVDLPKAFSEANVPIRCVNAEPYGPISKKTEVEINRKYADFDVIEMKGVGHYPMFEKPEEFNERLKEAIRAASAKS